MNDTKGEKALKLMRFQQKQAYDLDAKEKEKKDASANRF